MLLFMKSSSTLKLGWLVVTVTSALFYQSCGPTKDNHSIVRASSSATPERICVFLHGAGENPTSDRIGLSETPKQSWSFPFGDYWGTKRRNERYIFNWDKVPCTKFLYGDFPTRDQTWRNEDVLKAFANFAMGNDHLGRSMTGGKRPHKVFAHSMGNNILANAIRLAYLPKNFQWYAIQAPFLGSPSAHYLAAACKEGHPLATLATIFSACLKPNQVPDDQLDTAGKKDLRTEASKDLHPETAPSDDPGTTLADGVLARIAQNHTAGIHCSTSPVGLRHPVVFPLLKGLSDLVYFTGDTKAYAQLGFTDKTNDGMVPVQSCQAGAPKGTVWGTSSTAAFYLSDLSHFEGAGRNGEPKDMCDGNDPTVKTKCAIDWIAEQVRDDALAFERR
jgi:hypothetical protein